MADDNPQNLPTPIYSYRAQLKLERTPNLSAPDIIKAGGGLEAPPQDGKIYGRQDANWIEVIPTTALAPGSGSITEQVPLLNRLAVRTKRMDFQGNETVTKVNLVNSVSDEVWTIQAQDAGNVFIYRQGSQTIQAVIKADGGISFNDGNGETALDVESNGSVIVGGPTGAGMGQGVLNTFALAINGVLAGPIENLQGWVPVDGSGAGLTIGSNDARYWRNGKRIEIVGDVIYPTTSDTSAAAVGGLPFDPVTLNANIEGFAITGNTGGLSITCKVIGGTRNFAFFDESGNQFTNDQLSGQTISFAGSYHMP